MENSLNKLIKNQNNSVQETLHRTRGVVVENITGSQQVVVQLPEFDDAEILILNKTGEYLSNNDNVWVYYWTQLNCGYVGLRVNKTDTDMVFSNNYVCNYESMDISHRVQRNNFICGTVEFTGYLSGIETGAIEPPDDNIKFTQYSRFIVTPRIEGLVSQNYFQYAYWYISYNNSTKKWYVYIDSTKTYNCGINDGIYFDWICIKL